MINRSKQNINAIYYDYNIKSGKDTVNENQNYSDNRQVFVMNRKIEIKNQILIIERTGDFWIWETMYFVCTFVLISKTISIDI